MKINERFIPLWETVPEPYKTYIKDGICFSDSRHNSSMMYGLLDLVHSAYIQEQTFWLDLRDMAWNHEYGCKNHEV